MAPAAKVLKPQLKWDTAMQECLLVLIWHNKAHIANTKNVTELWNKVNDQFYSQEVHLPYKEHCYTKDNPRHLRTKFKKIYDTVMKVIEEGGNRSGKEGDLSKIYKYIQDMSNEIKGISEDKADKAGLKSKLDETADTVLARKHKKPIEGYGDRMDLDGIITSTKKPKVVKGDVMEEYLMSLLKDGAAGEEVVEGQMNAWIAVHSKTEDDLLFAANIQPEDKSNVYQETLDRLCALFKVGKR